MNGQVRRLEVGRLHLAAEGGRHFVTEALAACEARASLHDVANQSRDKPLRRICRLLPELLKLGGTGGDLGQTPGAGIEPVDLPRPVDEKQITEGTYEDNLMFVTKQPAPLGKQVGRRVM